MIGRNLQPAIALIKAFEGLRDGDPTSIRLDPYLCPAGYWTIGWGHVVLDRKGQQVRGRENKKLAYSIYPNGITMAEATALLDNDVDARTPVISRAIKVDLNDNQFCALLSFAFNVGLDAFKDSTLIKMLNRGEMEKVSAQFMRWNKAMIGGVKKESPGLTRRRKAEVMLWGKAP